MPWKERYTISDEKSIRDTDIKWPGGKRCCFRVVVDLSPACAADGIKPDDLTTPDAYYGMNGGLDALTVLGVYFSHHRLKGAREGTRPQAVDHFEVRRPDHTSSLKGPFPGSHGAGVEREPQALLTLAQRALRLLLLGDIFHQYDHSPNVAMLRHVG